MNYLIILFAIAMILLCAFVLYTYIQTVHSYESRIITPWNKGIFTDSSGTVLKGYNQNE